MTGDPEFGLLADAGVVGSVAWRNASAG